MEAGFGHGEIRKRFHDGVSLPLCVIGSGAITSFVTSVSLIDTGALSGSRESARDSSPSVTTSHRNGVVSGHS